MMRVSGGVQGRRNATDTLGKLGSRFEGSSIDQTVHRWQKLRQAEVDLEKELFEAELERLTTRERDLRRRIEDIYAAHPDANPASLVKSARVTNHDASEPNDMDVNVNGVNGIDGVNGMIGVEDDEKKGKKRKMEAR